MPRPAVHPRTLSVARWGWRHDFPCTAAGPHIFARVWTQCTLDNFQFTKKKKKNSIKTQIQRARAA